MLSDDIATGITEREAKLNLAPGVKVKPGPVDSSIFDTEDGPSIADKMAEQGVRWELADKSPGSRKNGWERLRMMLKAALSVPMEEPGLFVFNTCTDGFIRTVPVLPRDKKKTDDVDSSAEDHTGDEVRYRVMARTQRRIRML